MVIDSHECYYCKVMLCYDKLQNDICLSAASMSESDFDTKTNQDDDLGDNHSLGSIDSLDWTLLVEWHDDNYVHNNNFTPG